MGPGQIGSGQTGLIGLTSSGQTNLGLDRVGSKNGLRFGFKAIGPEAQVDWPKGLGFRVTGFGVSGIQRVNKLEALRSGLECKG